MYLGEEIRIFDWFRLHYIENNGMSYGLEFRRRIWEIIPHTF